MSKRNFRKTRNFRFVKIHGEHGKPQGGVFKGEDNMQKARTKESILLEAKAKESRRKKEEEQTKHKKTYEDRMAERERKMYISSILIRDDDWYLKYLMLTIQKHTK